jgi:hypothetical protein
VDNKDFPNLGAPEAGMTAGRFIWLWFPVAAWMAVIFIGSSFPAGVINTPPEIFMFAAHFLEFLILALFMIRALNGAFGRPLSLGMAFAAFVVCLAYGILDEFHQLFVPGRVADPIDLATDATGAAAACALALLIGFLIRRARNRRGEQVAG